MLSQWIRVRFDDNGTQTDYSIASAFGSGLTVSWVAADDYLYVGQHYPFNNLFIEMGSTVNANSSVMSIEYYDGSSTEWRSAIDILDGTSSGGATLAQSGIVQWSPDSDYSWERTPDDSSGTYPTALSSPKIYSMYWVRIKVSADLTASTIISRIAYAFTYDSILPTYDPQIDDYLSAWASGKTDWWDQIVEAGVHVVNDLRSRGLIVAPGQILRFDDVYVGTTYMTLTLIYSGLKGDFNAARDWAYGMYKKNMSLRRFTFDTNKDGRQSRSESKNRVGTFVR